MSLQGEIYWIDLGESSGAGPGYLHPHVVVQSDLFNRSRIRTTVVCALTSNLSRAEAPGNVPLKKGEANLPKASVVNVSQIFTVDQDDLGGRIGKLSEARLEEVLEGLSLLLSRRGR